MIKPDHHEADVMRHLRALDAREQARKSGKPYKPRKKSVRELYREAVANTPPAPF